MYEIIVNSLFLFISNLNCERLEYGCLMICSILPSINDVHTGIDINIACWLYRNRSD